MKKILITVIALTLLAAFAIAQENSGIFDLESLKNLIMHADSQERECVKECNKMPTEDRRVCTDLFNDEMDLCKETYSTEKEACEILQGNEKRECLKNASDNKKECERTAINNKKQCYEQARFDKEMCKVNCRLDACESIETELQSNTIANTPENNMLSNLIRSR